MRPKDSLTPYSELESVIESDDFPEEFFTVKVLPELLKAVEFGGGGPKSFGIVMKIATKLSDDEYDVQITPAIVRLFTSPDRALRVCLLDNLPLMIDHLSGKLVTDKIFPQMVTGFGDIAPVVREQTLKAMLVVAPKLSERTINGELLRHLAKTANDDQPGIRTNTTICLGKIARSLAPGSRGKVLSAAFSRALRDPFVHARNAALLALAATADIFSEEDCATKMLPAICSSLIDKEKLIRDQANKTLNIYLDRVRKYSATLPDTSMPSSTVSAPSTRISTPQPGVSNQLMGWAISSFTNKISSASGEIQSNSNGVRPTHQERPTSTPPTSGLSRPATQHITSAPVVPKVTTGIRSSAIPYTEVEDEDFGDGWGDMDDAVVDAWNEDQKLESSTTARHPSTTSTAAVSYDDGGEPDFEGWLNAQAQAKTQSKRPLPKGLTKKTAPATKSNAAPRSNAKSSGSTSTGAAMQIKPASKAEPTAEAEEDDWGDAWG